MAGDRARVSYDPSRKWRGLIAQQGRVTVEADWNEAATIAAERDRRVTLDAVGQVGTPNGGYSVTVASPGDLSIAPGTLYLGGERLDLDAAVTYSAQPDWLDYSTDPLWVAPPWGSTSGTSYELAYLLASEQEVSAVEDPALTDVALGGPDTMQRQRILQRFVRQGFVPKESTSGTCSGAWTNFVNTLSPGLRFDPTSMMIKSATTLQVSFTAPTSPPSLCQPVATGGYLGAENQMIRVMVSSIDHGTGLPTIVWGFDDASFLYRIKTATYDSGTGNTTLTLATAPADSYHYPQAGQAVELLRDAVQLTTPDSTAVPPITGDYIAAATGLVMSLVATYDPTQMQLVIPGQLPDEYQPPATPQLYLRVWQQTTAPTAQQVTTFGASGVAVTLELGDTGVAVTLSSSTGTFHAGDFWRFALRPIQPAIVYPARYLDGGQPPDGPRTWACPLAVLTWTDGNPTALSCVPRFSDLVELTAKGSCCTADVGPSDVGGGTALQALLDGYAGQGPVTICLEPGIYTLTAPLVLGPGLDDITLQGCRGGVVLQAGQPGAAFVLGLIAMQGARSVTIRGIELSVPLAGFTPPAGSFTFLPAANLQLLTTFSTDLMVAIGISGTDSPGLTIEDCTFSFPDPGQANVFGAGIFAAGAMNDVTVRGCSFQAVSPPETVPFYDLTAGNSTQPPYQLTFGYLQPPFSPSASSAAQLLDNAAIEDCLFQGITVAALAMTQLGTLRIDRNTVRNCYGGFWLLSVTSPELAFILDEIAVGDPGEFESFSAAGIAAVLDRIFVMATSIGQVLPATPPIGAALVASRIPPPGTAQLARARRTFDAWYAHAIRSARSSAAGPAATAGGAPAEDKPADAGPADAGPGGPPPATDAAVTRPGAAAIPVADPGTSVSLRLDFGNCQVDAVIAGSYSGAGLVVFDFAQDVGSALIHDNRIRDRFALGETALAWGLTEACVTTNIVANEIVPSGGTGGSADSRSFVLLQPSEPLGVPTVAITGNVFIDFTILPARPATIPPVLADWNVLNTVIGYFSPPIVTAIAPTAGAAGTLVTISGSGFTGATSVAFGPVSITSITVVNDGQITVASPPGGGTVDVTVTNPAGTSPFTPTDQFTYTAPVVTAVTPNTGLFGLVTPVIISGSGFTAVTGVLFGPEPAVSWTFVADSQIEAASPPGLGFGPVDVMVITPAGTSAIGPGGEFFYQPGLQ